MLNKYLLILLVLFHSKSFSSILGYGTDIHFKGRLFEPGCEFNNNVDMDIDFGMIGIKKVNGKEYTKKISIPMKCKGSLDKSLYIQIQGNTVGGYNNVISTSKENLGIIFNDNIGNPIILNNFLKAKDDKLYEFIVTPIMLDMTKQLDVGYFSATATLISTYF
ncbi:fimbrial protein [Proteus vulgaris]|uniref:fimbrial protein n=1 Tax=Proteus vulgaris TaxID=585 RepID=UPI000506B099|nr:fimbrial protein [Proteus vulgaris]KGA58532.1 fimbrial family protein [Proteus vulgaris]MBG5986804.1 fimbrial protein [Proteus vulgaris]HCN43470.1 fimbrial protein [Proteus vulgaris]